MAPKLAIIYYSVYGHVKTLAEAIAKGVASTGATCDIYQVAETLPEETLREMHAPPRSADHPIIEANQLVNYDGFIFGLSGRFGAMPAQMKSFMDSTGPLWASGSLVGKAAGTFTSVATQGGGQETVNISMFSFIAIHGMCFVPMGYVDKRAFSFDEVHGASAYGPGTYASSDGSRQPSELELGMCDTYGKHFAKITSKLAVPDE